MVKSPSHVLWVCAVIGLALMGCYEDGEDQVIEQGDAGLPPPECSDGDRRPCDVSEGCGGVQTCLPNGTYGPCSAPEEICDGRDNDCDGVADEEFPTVGDACSAGEGTCLDRGEVVCTDDGSGTMCDARPGDGTTEVCDGIDNDCDGDTDEDVPTGVACDTGLPGVCSAGTTTCEGGDTVCQSDVEAADEGCDGLDNDCDGNTDEAEMGGPLAESCYDGPAGTAGEGACAAGVRQCSDGAFGDCVDQVLPSDEVCDGVDNDCNGTIDDVAEGDCVCAAGTVAPCYDGPDGTEGVGICQGGSRTCNDDGTGYGACVGQRLPGAEICDGLDNDCDGVADDVSGVGDACSAGQGACLVDGTRVCDPASGLVVCDAEPGLPSDEVCDGLDNDCDGAIDDVAGAGEPCEVGVGACLDRGVRVCDPAGGPGLVCDAVEGAPSDEVCDGRDNDCDGEIDDVDGVGVECAVGVGACRSTALTTCDPAGSGEVICPATAQDAAPSEYCGNGIDDDCDGETDELECIIPCDVDGDCRGPGETCVDGACVATACATDDDCPDGQQCVEQVCIDAEICDDGVDNDGDGAVDCADDGCADDPVCVRDTGCGAGQVVGFGTYRATLEGESVIATAPCALPTDTTGPEAVFVFDAAAGGEVCVDTLGSMVDTVLTVRGEPCEVDDFVIACNDDAGAEFETGSQVGFTAVAGTTYYFVADSFEGSAGEVTLTVSAGPCGPVPGVEICGNDEDDDDDNLVDCLDDDCAGDPICQDPTLCDDATPLALGRTAGMAMGPSRTSTASCTFPPNGADGPEMIYAFVPEDAGTYCVDTRGSMIDTVLTVRGEPCQDPASEIGCNDDAGMGFDASSEVEVELMADATYYVVVDSFVGGGGAFVLNVRAGGCDQAPVEICDDGFDNDGDGDVDCDDADCTLDPACPLLGDENCGDGIDNDGDGDVDCADAECALSPLCVEDCNNNIDDDGDGDVDCDDIECLADLDCLIGPIEDCDNGEDDDGDGAVDCDDLDCADSPICPVDEICDNTLDDDLDGDIDCADADCADDPVCAPAVEICDNGQDDDGDGAIDCDDADCAADPACAPPGGEICDNGQDDDDDGLVDCLDDDCAADPACQDPGLCADAAPIDLGRTAGVLMGDSRTSSASCTFPPNGADGPEMVYVFTPGDDGTYCVDTRGSMVDTVLTVRGEPCDDPASEIGCSDDDGDEFDASSQVEVELMADTPYYVVVDTFDGGDGAFVVNLRAGGCDAPPVEICDDGFDNDDDGDVDCDDLDCAFDPACPLLGDENCGDGVDNDGDGDVDCADADCGLSPLCVEDCNNNLDDDGDGDIDCADLECIADLDCLLGPDEDCDNGADDDGDGAIDCDDADCAGDPACPPPVEICDNGQDDDGDGDVDCDDADCAGDASCAAVGLCETPQIIDGPGVYLGDTTGQPSNHTETDEDCVTFAPGQALSPESVLLWMPEEAGDYCLLTTGSAFDTVLYVRVDACEDPAAELVCNDDSAVAGTTRSAVDLSVEAGRAYYVFVDGFGQDPPRQGQYTLTVRPGPCVPVVEICDNGEDDDGDGDIDCEDADCADDPACAPPVEICDNGEDDDGDGDIDCDDADCAGDFACVVCGPNDVEPNEDIATATPLEPGQYDGLGICVPDDEDVYAIELCAGGTLSVSVLFIDDDGDIDAFVLDADGNELDRGFSSSDNEEVGYVNGGGDTTVYLRVDGFQQAVNTYALDVAVDDCGGSIEICDDGVDNDGDGDIDCDDSDCADDPACGEVARTCDDPRAIGFETLTVQLDGASNIDDASCTLPVDGADGPEGVFAFTAEADGTVCVDTLGSMVDTVLTVRGEPCEGPGSEIACDDDGGMAGTSQVEFDTAAGESWFIVVDTFAGEAGEAMVTVADGPCAPIGPVEICDDGDDNDDDGLIDCADTDCAGDIACNNPLVCLGADPIGFGTQQGELDGESVTSLASCAFPANAATGPEALFLYTAVEAGTVCADTFGSAVDTILTARDETCNRPQSELACSDDEMGFASQVEVEVEAGGLYYFAVDTYGGDRGAYTFRLRPGSCDVPVPAEACDNGGDDDFDGDVDCDDADCAGAPACVDPADVCTFDFEGGDVDPAFTTDGDAPWTVADGVATSGDIGDEQTSTLRLAVATPAGGAVSFRYRVSSEERFDDFRFLIDGALVLEANGEVPFTPALFALTPGDHILEWVYAKDINGADGEDLAQIDDVAISGTGGVCEGTIAEICDNGADDDGDGDVDCDDADCAADPACIPDEICDNGVDDDGDGDTDCADADCLVDAACVVCPDDDFEPNEDIAGATPIEPGQYDGLAICVPDDEDVYAIAVCAGGTLTVDVRFVDDDGDIDAKLLDAAGVERASSTSTTDDERVSYTALAAGETIYLRVFGFRGATNVYALEVALEGCDAPFEICDNGADDDGDGDVDCDDADCAAGASCLPPLIEENCEDGLDDDDDGDIDCADADCQGDPACELPLGELDCTDGLDDDGDGDIDCTDVDCVADPACAPVAELVCDDGLDDDGDGDIDCADADCQGDPDCFAPADGMFFVLQDSAARASRLYRRDGDGTVTLIGNTTLAGIDAPVEAIALSPAGELVGFAITKGSEMVTIDPETAAVAPRTDADGVPLAFGALIVGAGYAPDGTLYVVDAFTSAVYTVPEAAGPLEGPVAALPDDVNGGDIAFDADGGCYLAGVRFDDNDLGLYRCDFDGAGFALVDTAPAGFDDVLGIAGLAFGPSDDPCVGALYGLDTRGLDEIALYDLTADPVGPSSIGGFDDDFATLGYGDAAGAFVPPDLPECGPAVEICDSGVDEDGDGAIDCADPDCDADPVCAPRAPGPGDLMISEILYDPVTVGQGFGEYIELRNISGAVLELQGLIMRDNAGRYQVATSFLLLPDDYVVFGRRADPALNGGTPVDFAMGNVIQLGDTTDTLRVLFGDPEVEIDRVVYNEAAGWPRAVDASIQFGAEYDPVADDNSLPRFWCVSSTPFGTGNRGTPGAPNEECGPPLDGDLVVNEIMQNPNAIGDATGEWIELYNGGPNDIDLSGWTLRDDGADTHLIVGPLVIASGGYLTMARSAMPGFMPDYVYATFLLGNADDEVVLVDTTGVIRAAVRYDGGPVFPDPDGASMQFDTRVRATSVNAANGANWCTSIDAFGAGDRGTPGAANVACGPVD